MSQPYPERAEPAAAGDARADLERTPEQAAHETAMREVSETLLNIEQTLRRAERAHAKVSATVDDHNLELALTRAVEQLRTTRTELFQRGYFGGDQQRLL